MCLFLSFFQSVYISPSIAFYLLISCRIEPTFISRSHKKTEIFKLQFRRKCVQALVNHNLFRGNSSSVNRDWPIKKFREQCHSGPLARHQLKLNNCVFCGNLWLFGQTHCTPGIRCVLVTKINSTWSRKRSGLSEVIAQPFSLRVSARKVSFVYLFTVEIWPVIRQACLMQGQIFLFYYFLRAHAREANQESQREVFISPKRGW